MLHIIFKMYHIYIFFYLCFKTSRYFYYSFLTLIDSITWIDSTVTPHSFTLPLRLLSWTGTSLLTLSPSSSATDSERASGSSFCASQSDTFTSAATMAACKALSSSPAPVFGCGRRSWDPFEFRSFPFPKATVSNSIVKEACPCAPPSDAGIVEAEATASKLVGRLSPVSPPTGGASLQGISK